MVRFPADAPPEAVEEIGRLANERGHQRVIIQLLPYTRAALDELIEATVERINLAEITANPGNKKK